MKSLCLQLALGGVLAFAVGVSPPDAPATRPDITWTMERLAEEMAALGYKTEWVDTKTYPDSWTQGLFLARQDDKRTWEEIVGNRTKTNIKQWEGLIVVCRANRLQVVERQAESLFLGTFWFFGDPDEITRIAEHFGAD